MTTAPIAQSQDKRGRQTREFSALNKRCDKALSAIQEYERRKWRWILDHPNARPKEYEEAVRKIAKGTGV